MPNAGPGVSARPRLQHHGGHVGHVVHERGRVRHAAHLRRRVRSGRRVRALHSAPGTGGHGDAAGPVPGALLVRTQPRQLGVGRLAHVALVGPLACVQAHVVAQGGRLAEAAVAEAADEGLVQRVDAHVGAQVAAGVEAAVADDAAHAPRRHHGGRCCRSRRSRRRRRGGRGGGGRGAVAGVELVWTNQKQEFNVCVGERWAAIYATAASARVPLSKASYGTN